jgi:hypothetical protein
MRKRGLVLFLGFIVTFALIQTVAAHVPLFMEGGHTLEEAVVIENPTKSWVIYSMIDEVAEPHYFNFEMQAGERIRLILHVPVPDGLQGFRPHLALMGNGLTNLSTPPDYLEIPSGAGVMILEPTTPHPEYEGFTPTSFYELYDLDITAPTTGEYYLAYYEPTRTGNFAVAIGYQEIFTITEWITVPFNVLVTHLWNYQAPFTLILPVLITLLIGYSLLYWRYPTLRTREQILSWLGITAGLLFIASGVFIFYQMVYALLQVPANMQIGITIAFGLLPVVLGLFTLRTCLSTEWTQKPRQLVLLFILGSLALFFWAGWILGPSVLLITTIIPSIQLLVARRIATTS